MSKVRTWIGVLNNPQTHYKDWMAQDFLEGWILKAKAQYVCGQMEQGAEGTPHVQYALNFKQP